MNNISIETKKILNIISDFGPIRPSEIAKKAELSNTIVHKHIRRLLDEELIQKTGEVPVVFYQQKIQQEFFKNSPSKSDWLVEENYIYVSGSGELIRGLQGFFTWCKKNNFDFAKERESYLRRLKAVAKIKKNNLISAKNSILSGKKKLYLDNTFFSDFYNIDHFGKTRLGQLVYVGKTSQNKALIKEVANNVKQDINFLIEKYKVSHVCFVPPTIGRKVQFMSVLSKELNLDLPQLEISKVKTTNLIPQKTIRKLEDRITNARMTISLNPNQQILSNVLIIDDATGSGATLNEIARKIRLITTTKIKIIGYSVIGSFKNFDVISEV